MKYRIIGKPKRNGEICYRVQESLLGIIWTTVKWDAVEAPHPDLRIPGPCTINAVFGNDIQSAEKCLKGLTILNKI